jgi:hypothetical protein
MDDEQPYRCVRYSGSQTEAMWLWKDLLSARTRGAKSGSAETTHEKIYTYTKPLGYTTYGYGVNPFQTDYIEDKGTMQFDFVFAKDKNKKAYITLCLFLDQELTQITGEAAKQYYYSVDNSFKDAGKKLKEFKMHRLPAPRQKRNELQL